MGGPARVSATGVGPMISAHSGTVLTLALSLIFPGCASRPPADPAATPDPAAAPRAAGDAQQSRPPGKPKPPQRLDRSFPEITITGSVPGSTQRAMQFLDVSVEIDPEGRPDLSTLRVTGPGAPENRSEISRWINAGVYSAATDAWGRPVRGLYKMKLRLGG